MTLKELEYTLNKLLKLSGETEVVEFKEAKNGFDSSKLGKYFSALSNEANLQGKSCGWLIFGVEDRKHKIVGSSFRADRKALDSLKGEIATKTTNRITFTEIYELQRPEGRVVMFQIPPAPKGLPVAYDGHYYGRDGEELGPLNLEEIERIRKTSLTEDWSAATVEGASLSDLDPLAILKARENFKRRYTGNTAECDSWDDKTFLNKAGLTLKGKITRTAIILVGKSESDHMILPSECKLRWLLKDANGDNLDHKIFTCPLIISVESLYGEIRNLKYRYIKDGTLFPEEVTQYEPFVIREALNNCIAHQDYTQSGRINVVEFTDGRLLFSNYGVFIPGSVEKAVQQDAPEEQYRNPFLAKAMVNLNMVETAGGGIRKMFAFQRQRFFPMPDYDFSDKKVTVTITGKILDMEFARILARNPYLSLEEIIILDKVQKKKSISDAEILHLRKLGLIEGRKPNFVLSEKVVGPTEDDLLKAQYIQKSGFDDDHYKKLIIRFIEKFETATKKQIEDLLLKKLPDVLDDVQKKNKVKNLLSSLRKAGFIKTNGFGTWIRTDLSAD